MKLYIGGAHQGQAELARAENPGAEVFENFHLQFRSLEGEPRAFAAEFCRKHPCAVIVADEVGCGVVPIDPVDRAWREKAGRALCVIAQNAESVVRVTCGIGVRIK